MMARTGINGAKRGKRLRRVEKQEATLRALLDAAARVVGRDGYAGASVAKITALAGVAQGTFYNYFRSRQDLFDRLLPELGGRLLETIRERLAGCRQGLKREEIGFRAFFDFLVETPSFYRVLNEAEVFAPKAFRDHMANMADGYLRALRISRAKGDLPGYGDDELETLVYTLLAARNYLSYRFTHRGRTSVPIPENVVRGYMKFVAGGMRHGGRAWPERAKFQPSEARA